MALIQTCKCEECGMQKSFANHWVMVLERTGKLMVLPHWDEKLLKRSKHFCGPAHASRFMERWIASKTTESLTALATMELVEELVEEQEEPLRKVTHFPQASQAWLDDEADAMAAVASVRYA